MKNEIMFIGMDIPKELEKLAIELESKITNGMNNAEIKLYRFGVKNIISLLSSLLIVDNENFVVHIDGFKCQEELDLSELEKIAEVK